MFWLCFASGRERALSQTRYILRSSDMQSLRYIPGSLEPYAFHHSHFRYQCRSQSGWWLYLVYFFGLKFVLQLQWRSDLELCSWCLQIDLLENPAIDDVVVLSIVLEEVKNRNLSVYNRVRALCSNSLRKFFVFSNEHHK